MYLASCVALGPLCVPLSVCIEERDAFDDLATKRGNGVPNVLAKTKVKRQSCPKQASRSVALEYITSPPESSQRAAWKSLNLNHAVLRCVGSLLSDVGSARTLSLLR